MNNLFFYPTVDEKMREDAGCYCDEYFFDYFSDDSFHTLHPKKGKNAYKFDDDTWKIENDGLRITRSITIEYPKTLKGVQGVVCREAEIGVCIIWNNKKLTQMGYIMPENIEKYGEAEVYKFSHTFEPGQIKGNISLEAILYVKTPAKQVDQDEQHLMNEAGVSLGTIDFTNLSFENNHMEFPIVEVKEAGEPLWWLELNDWEDPTRDSFNEDFVCLYLNSYYEVCPKAGEGFDNLDLLIEILTSAYLMIIKKIEEMNYLKNTIENIELEPGSISMVIYHFYKRSKYAIKNESIDELHKSIHCNIEAMLKGGTEND